MNFAQQEKTVVVSVMLREGYSLYSWVSSCSVSRLIPMSTERFMSPCSAWKSKMLSLSWRQEISTWLVPNREGLDLAQEKKSRKRHAWRQTFSCKSVFGDMMRSLPEPLVDIKLSVIHKPRLSSWQHTQCLLVSFCLLQRQVIIMNSS